MSDKALQKSQKHFQARIRKRMPKLRLKNIYDDSLKQREGQNGLKRSSNVVQGACKVPQIPSAQWSQFCCQHSDPLYPNIMKVRTTLNVLNEYLVDPNK
uniref:Uncharacterized protein n=1 Tax=Arundo donax TaxID=35708 RepID=A0A0A9BE38_ARUDO